MKIMATSKNYGKKSSDHFRDILNPYGEKPNYGKIGRRRRLSKLNVFFSHNSVGDHNSLNYTPSIPQKIRLDLKEQIATKNIREIAVCSGMLHNHLTNQTIVFRFKCRQNPVKQNYQIPLKSY